MCNVNDLNHEDVEVRLQTLATLMKEAKEPERKDYYVNNHIHTFYSFSPYSPTKAIYTAFQAGLSTAGIMDHDSVAGCNEFIKAGEIAGVATTIGAELRCDFSKTAMWDKRINNPDQKGIGYVALHSIPHQSIDAVQEYIKPYGIERDKRNRKMVEKLNSFSEIQLDYDEDVVPISKQSEGGSITERHILYALALKIIGTGEDIPTYLDKAFDIQVSGKLREFLEDKTNPFIDYDLLGVLKSTLISKVYIPATTECPDVEVFVEMAKKTGAIAAYPYLGNVGESVTGDKKAQTFEDEYLDVLFEEINRLGFRAVTYMPTRNTEEQLMRIKALCKQYGFMEICGEDINTPRQGFICEKLQNPVFSNLIESTWELVRHEREVDA